MIKTKLLQSIRWYQLYISPDTGSLKVLFPQGICRFSPTCSEYTYRAISRYGIIKGLFLGAKRIIRCNPFSKGGIDNIK